MTKKRRYYFNWRTAPRSIAVLLSWLPIFYKFENEAYNERAKNKFTNEGYKKNVIYPTRRKITYEYEKNHDGLDPFLNLPYEDFINGRQTDKADKESRVRQAVTTAEQYGFMDSKTAKLTPVGKRVITNSFTAEDFLIQLLKMYIVTNDNEEGVFPFKTVIELINRLSKLSPEDAYLSRNEMTFVFGTLHDSDIENTYDAVHEFRREYRVLPNKNSTKSVDKLLVKVWNNHFYNIPSAKITGSIKKDYTDALTRALNYTELFYDHGRGTATKIRVNKFNQEKFNMLVNDFEFIKPPLEEVNGTKRLVGSRNSLEWFGSVGNIALPWDKRENRIQIVYHKLQEASKLFKNIPNPAITEATLKSIQDKISNSNPSISDIKDYEAQLDQAISVRNEEEYVQVLSKDSKSRAEILDKFNDIQNNADMAALWLEVNTWRAFVSIDGDQKRVVHNFKMNPDLTPKSFAPGTENTPDMEVYFDDSLILPEVSLMSGVMQWEHEASSVVNHVYKKIVNNKEKNVIGLFISKSINIRTMWQFFLLNRESWIGEPVPVVPMKIETFKEIMNYSYRNNIDIYKFNKLIQSMSRITKTLPKYKEWDKKMDEITEQWKLNKGSLPEGVVS